MTDLEFQESIKDLDETNKALMTATRKSMLALKEELESALISKEAYELEINALKEATKSDNEATQKELEKLHKFAVETSKKLKEAQVKGTLETPVESLAKEIVANKADLEAIGKGITTKEITLKAEVLRTSITSSTMATVIDGIGQLGVKERSLYDVATKIQLGESNNQGNVKYLDWDEDTIARAAAMVGESGTFPESTAKFKQYELGLKKIGDTLPVSEEFFEDEALAAQELDIFLNVNVNAVVDDQIVNGDNTGNNMKGLLVSVPEYTPTAAGLADANIYDLIQKMTTAITKNRGSKYKRERIKAAMNSEVYDALVLKKDANNNYQFPPNHPIFSRIVVDNNLADNKMVVGDMLYMKIYEKGGVVVSKGEISTQFTEDMMTLKARTRKLFLIRAADQTGFLKCSDVDAAIATITASVMP